MPDLGHICIKIRKFDWPWSKFHISCSHLNDFGHISVQVLYWHFKNIFMLTKWLICGKNQGIQQHFSVKGKQTPSTSTKEWPENILKSVIKAIWSQQHFPQTVNYLSTSKIKNPVEVLSSLFLGSIRFQTMCIKLVGTSFLIFENLFVLEFTVVFVSNLNLDTGCLPALVFNYRFKSWFWYFWNCLLRAQLFEFYTV